VRRFATALLVLVLLVGAGLPAPAAAATRQLRSYWSLRAALLRGESVRVVTHYGRCALSVDGEAAPAPDAIGILLVDACELFVAGSIGNEQEFLAFSHTTLINRQGFVYNYVKFRVYADGSVSARAMYVNPGDYSIVMDEEFTTRIDDGRDSGAAAFFIPR
jgi:hypothetical protein